MCYLSNFSKLNYHHFIKEKTFVNQSTGERYYWYKGQSFILNTLQFLKNAPDFSELNLACRDGIHSLPSQFDPEGRGRRRRDSEPGTRGWPHRYAKSPNLLRGWMGK